MVHNNGNNNNKSTKGSMVLKLGSDNMRAFYDFCMDFMVEEEFPEEILVRTDDLLNWCEDPDMVKMALFDMKKRRKKLKL